jgi:hypothetical protein
MAFEDSVGQHGDLLSPLFGDVIAMTEAEEDWSGER